jgi:hypothetical protein
MLRDGEHVRVSMLLADQAPMRPWPRPAPPRYHYGIGYVADARALRSSPVLSAADAAYTEMRDSLSNEWRRYGPACCDGCKDQNVAPPHELEPINAWPTREWPHGGYGPDPTAAGGTMWPDPADLQSQHEGDPCTINGAPGTLRRAQGGKFVCVPNRGRDSAEVMAVGPGPYPVGYYAEGAECRLPTGELGQLVREGDELNCRCRSDFDAATVTSAQARRDAAYQQSVRDAENAWKQPWRAQP